MPMVKEVVYVCDICREQIHHDGLDHMIRFNPHVMYAQGKEWFPELNDYYYLHRDCYERYLEPYLDGRRTNPRFDPRMIRATAQELLSKQITTQIFLENPPYDFDRETVENFEAFLHWICDHGIEYFIAQEDK